MEDIDLMFNAGKTVVVSAAQRSPLANALRSFLNALSGKRDERSALKAPWDAWRLRNFAGVFGLAHRLGYGWQLREGNDSIEVIFRPDIQAMIH